MLGEIAISFAPRTRATKRWSRWKRQMHMHSTLGACGLMDTPYTKSKGKMKDVVEVRERNFLQD